VRPLPPEKVEPGEPEDSGAASPEPEAQA
jgi:hypothetical protein